jgi:hypothetical protein
MHKCNNCNSSFDSEAQGLLLTARGKAVTAICGPCCKDVRVGKIVIKKAEIGGFAHEEWQPVEMTTSGLSTNKHVG